ncbi:hypothetical protein H5410_003008 [Solanum commersonii]|uniref:Uncharacterized protein n=1 Tax=Solanum commersonii TaxID=4109 RepID=A0A9J6B3U1_SOLCO|nr:hypothetical protein H5410_003008 [Solanum commersonii]
MLLPIISVQWNFFLYMMLCSAFTTHIQTWLRDYDRIQSFAVILIYVQIGCALIGSLGALYNGVSLINLGIGLFALVAIESSSQSLGRTYAVLLFCAILVDISWFILFASEIWTTTTLKASHISFPPYGPPNHCWDNPPSALVCTATAFIVPAFYSLTCPLWHNPVCAPEAGISIPISFPIFKEIKNISSGIYGTFVIFSVKLTLSMQIIGFCVRLSSSLLWIQMYKLGVSYIDCSVPREADSDMRNSFLNPATPLTRQPSNSDDALGGSVYDPAYYSSLFEDGKDETYFCMEFEGAKRLLADEVALQIFQGGSCIVEGMLRTIGNIWSNLSRSLHYEVGNDTKILLWKENWIGHETLMSSYPDLISF